MTHFHKRLKMEEIKEIDSLIHKMHGLKNKTKKKDHYDNDIEPPNKGQLIVDATCIPSDIHFPTGPGASKQGSEED